MENLPAKCVPVRRAVPFRQPLGDRNSDSGSLNLIMKQQCSQGEDSRSTDQETRNTGRDNFTLLKAYIQTELFVYVPSIGKAEGQTPPESKSSHPRTGA